MLTVGYKLNLMAPAAGEVLIARRRVVRAGRRVSVCAADVFCVADRQEALCATVLGTFMVLADTSDG